MARQQGHDPHCHKGCAFWAQHKADANAPLLHAAAAGGGSSAARSASSTISRCRAPLHKRAADESGRTRTT